MADAVVEVLLVTMTEMRKFYANLLSNAENELEQLKNDVAFLKGFLQYAAKQPMPAARFRQLERTIRDVVYDAEDTIDSCLIHAAATKGKFLARRFNLNRVSLAREVHYLRHNLEDLLDEACRLDSAEMKIEEGSDTSVEVPSIRQDNIVGFEDQEKIIIGHLMEEREQLDIISIIGMPGLGKTTLASKVFNNPEIQYKFYTRIWIYVSQIFNIRDILICILKEITGRDGDMFHQMNEADLILRVRARLEKGKFLLVMDDIWTIETWDVIKHVLPKSNGMGKVVITSRHKNVGRYANFIREPHMLRFLNNEESWQLLLLEVFGKFSCPPQLEGSGKCIAEQCGGLPLAIVVLGRILVRKAKEEGEERAWSSVSSNVFAYLREDPEQSVSNIVGLSYINLPDSLKYCFLYLGVFPKDYEIPVWTLTRLWIAEGFVKHKEGQRLEQTAENNLKELISRNLVMVGVTTPYGKPKTCRVHDVVHDFCISRAAPTDRDLFQEIEMSQESRDFDPPLNELRSFHRICIHSHISEFLEKRPMGHRVRSFLSFYKKPVHLNPKHTSTIPDAFNLLRVLDSKSFKLSHFPVKLTKLLHLRYITLSCDDLNFLPETLSGLWNLQTLLVNTKSPTLEMKANIWKMIQLRHFKTKAEIVLSVKGDGEGGENLQTLSRLSAKCCNEDMFKRARNLRTLGIRGSLASGRALPPVDSFPRNIKRLTLSATYLDWKDMSTLGMIATLEVLKLKDYAFMGMSWNVVGGFRSLQFLLIGSTDLVFWEASDDQYPKLTCLMLKNCAELREIPLGLAKTLRVLNIERVIPRSAIDSARKIEEKRKEMLELQGSRIERWGRFKLSLGPGCE